MTKVGLAGLGYWGPNLARNFHAMPETTVVSCCDASQQARERTLTIVPGTRMTDRIEDLLEDEALDAIALATPVPTHAELAVQVLQAGKLSGRSGPRPETSPTPRRPGTTGPRP